MLPGCNSSGTSEEHDHGHGHGHSHEDAEEGHLELSKKQMDAVGIRLGSLEARNMAEAINANGRLEVSASDEGIVASPLPGTISRILVSVGQNVKSGQTIAYVDCPELLSLHQEYLAAVQELNTARKEVERQQALASQGAGVRKNLDNAQAAASAASIRVEGCKARIAAYGLSPQSLGSSSTLPVKAQISGTVTEISGVIGAFADMQVPIARIVNTRGLYCTVQLLEKDLGKIREDQSVSMSLTNDPGVSLEGKVESINPSLDPSTRTAAVRVNLTDPGEGTGLIPGMAVTARINLEGNLTETLPEKAVVAAGGKHFIFILKDIEDEDGEQMYHFEKVEVATGATSLGYTEVTPLETLQDDVKIVVAGAFYLNSMSTDHGEHSH